MGPEQWLILVIASLGWVFDVFEGQVFVAGMKEAMPDLLPATLRDDAAFYNNVTFAAFLLGGVLLARYVRSPRSRPRWMPSYPERDDRE